MGQCGLEKRITKEGHDELCMVLGKCLSKHGDYQIMSWRVCLLHRSMQLHTLLATVLVLSSCGLNSP